METEIMTLNGQIAILNQIDPEHLAEVTDNMRTMGAPVIHAVWMECYNCWVALEGSHRIAAAHALGLTPEIIPVEYSETVTLEDLGCDDSGDGWTVAQVADDAWRSINAGLAYTFDNE